MNKGISLATGDYIIILNADDYYKKDAIEKLVQRAVEVKTDLVAAHSCNIDENNYQTYQALCRSTWTDFAYLISGVSAGERITTTAIEAPTNGMTVRTDTEDDGSDSPGDAQLASQEAEE